MGEGKQNHERKTTMSTTIKVNAYDIHGTDCSYCLTDKGVPVAEIAGEGITPVVASAEHFGADMITFAGITSPIRAVLAMALRGERGLSATVYQSKLLPKGF